MRRNILISVFIGLFIVSISIKAQTITVEGYAFLQKQTNHSGIQVLLHRTVPSSLYDTIITNSAGYYKKDIQKGIYDIAYKKFKFLSWSLKDVNYYNDKKMNDVTLIGGGLSGKLSGLLTKGDYVVEDSVWVDASDTLNIEPGTKLFIKNRKSITINGYLNAIGTEKDSIYFTRYVTDDDNADSILWGGIYLGLKGASSGYNNLRIYIKYCHFSYAKNYNVLKLEEANAKIENSLFVNCYGLNIFQSYSPKYIFRNIKFNNCNNADTTLHAWGIGCMYIVEYSKDIIHENIEITGIKSRLYSAVSTFTGGPWKLNNFYIHDNNCLVLQNYSSPVVFNNSTIVNNKYLHATVSGELFFNNCIIVNNEGGISQNTNNSLLLNNGANETSNKWVGVNVDVNRNGDSCDAYGNITLDPQFVNPSAMDYRLKPNSPCIDAGVNDSVFTKEDFFGRVRIFDGNNDGKDIVDMGAFEYYAPNDVSELSAMPVSADNISIYPNPASNFIITRTGMEDGKPRSASIYNSLGVKVLSLDIQGGRKINVSFLSPGAYFIVFDGEKGLKTESFIKL